MILSRPSRSRGDEPGVKVIRGGVHQQRALNTLLSSDTSAGTFACPAGPYRNCRGESDTKNEPNWYFVPVQKKGSENRSSCFEPKISLISFSRGSGPPLRCLSFHFCSQRPQFHPPLHVTMSESDSQNIVIVEVLSFFLGFRRPNLITGLSG